MATIFDWDVNEQIGRLWNAQAFTFWTRLPLLLLVLLLLFSLPEERKQIIHEIIARRCSQWRCAWIRKEGITFIKCNQNWHHFTAPIKWWIGSETIQLRAATFRIDIKIHKNLFPLAPPLTLPIGMKWPFCVCVRYQHNVFNVSIKSAGRPTWLQTALSALWKRKKNANRKIDEKLVAYKLKSKATTVYCLCLCECCAFCWC